MQLMSTKLEVFAELAAREQIAAQHTPHAVQETYAAFIRANRDKFLQMPIDVFFAPVDKYNVSLRALSADIRDNGELTVFTGGTLPASHPLAARDYGIYGNPNANEVFRAVHDYYGHYQFGLGFSTLAELRIAAFTMADMPSEALNALLCESVLQTCVYHLTGQYAEQKAFRVSDTLTEQWKQIARELRDIGPSHTCGKPVYDYTNTQQICLCD